jgi:hypothetical protein
MIPSDVETVSDTVRDIVTNLLDHNITAACPSPSACMPWLESTGVGVLIPQFFSFS